MKSKTVKTMNIVLPKSKAFAYDTPLDCPKAHQNCLIIGKRGSGKSVSCVNLIEKMKYDRLFIISPTMKSNKDLMARLNIAEEDIYEDPDDVECLDLIKEAVEQEAADLDKYIEDLKKYNQLMKNLNSNKPIEMSDELLYSFFNPDTGDFEKPKHRWGGRKPLCGLIIDDCLGSRLFGKGIQRLNKMTILHRHIGGLNNLDGAVGLSLYFLVQSYVCQYGGISKCIRNNATSIILFKTKNEKELQQVVDECSGEIDPVTFLKFYEYSMQDPHDFLFIDLHKKKEHPSGFRRNFNEYLLEDNFNKST